MPRSKFPENPAPEPGMMYMGETEQGKRVPCLIKKVEKDAIWMDFNHPLAGKPLNFQIKLISIHENE